jgi:ribose transport system permease protein
VIFPYETKMTFAPNSIGFKHREIGILLALLAEVLILTFFTSSFSETGWESKFLTYTNIMQILRSIAFIAIMAIGTTVVIVSGGIDLSVGSVMGLVGIIVSLLLTAQVSIGVSIFVSLLAACLLGSLNGVIITTTGVSPFITTLGMLSIARGFAYGLTGGATIRDLPENFLPLGQGTSFGIPNPVIILFVLAFFIDFFLKKTRWGRYCYAIGGNETAALFSGINVNKAKLFYYSIGGFTAGLAGILYVARFGVGQSTAGMGYELDVIASAVIGGASLSGGRGTILGALVGSVLMGVLRNGLVLLDVSAYWQQVAIGAVIILAVVIDIKNNK